MSARPISAAALILSLVVLGAAVGDDSPKPRIHECISSSAMRRNRVPIVDAECGANGQACEPPVEDEVLEELDRKFEVGSRRGRPRRENVRIEVEKIGHKLDLYKIYPLAGACQLGHCYYKCTVSFDERCDLEGPVPLEYDEHRVEVVFLEKMYLRRCQGEASDGDARGKGDAEQRLAAVEEKLDRVLRELEGLKAEVRGAKASGPGSGGR